MQNLIMAKKTILCAVDFSESSLHALKWTMGMAQLYKAEVTFLFCYRLITVSDEGELLNMKRDMEAEALSRFHQIEAKCIRATTVPYHFVMEIGFFSSRIELFTRRSRVSLLVLGTSMIKDFDEYKNLSFDKFLSAAKIPVIIAPEGASDFMDE